MYDYNDDGKWNRYYLEILVEMICESNLLKNLQRHIDNCGDKMYNSSETREILTIQGVRRV